MGETPAKKDNFLIVFLDVYNGTGKSDCIQMKDFSLINGQESYKMSDAELDPAGDIYHRSYPRATPGQCFDPGEVDQSVLAFDFPKTAGDYSLQTIEHLVLLGPFDAIQNPIPTATSTFTITPTFTVTPTITPTPYPSGKLNQGKASLNVINLRAGPGNNFSIVINQAVIPDLSFNLLGRNGTGDWLLVETQEGVRAWIDASFIETTRESRITSHFDCGISNTTPTLVPTRTRVPTKTLSRHEHRDQHLHFRKLHLRELGAKIILPGQFA